MVHIVQKHLLSFLNRYLLHIDTLKYSHFLFYTVMQNHKMGYNSFLSTFFVL